MARQRTIKPAFFEDEKLGEISPIARLLFIGMWVFSDDWGVVKGHPVWLRNNILPYDQIPVEEIEKHISDLVEIGVIVPFEHHNQKFLHIKNFEKHQTVKYPSETLRNPPPPTKSDKKDEKKEQKLNPPPVLPQSSPNPPGALPQPSPKSPPREKQRAEESSRERQRADEGRVGETCLPFENTFSALLFNLQRFDQSNHPKAKQQARKKAEELCQRFTPEHIERKTLHFLWVLRHRPELVYGKNGKGNPTGYFITSIEKDYPPPPGYDEWSDQQKKQQKNSRIHNENQDRSIGEILNNQNTKSPPF